MRYFLLNIFFFSVIYLNAQSLELFEKEIFVYENVGHASWNNAFDEPNFLKWIHSKSKK